jgi:hypothetical protein
MAARKAQNNAKPQNGAKRERVKIDPKELQQVKVVNYDELVALMGQAGAELFRRKIAEFVLTGKRLAVGIPKSLRGKAAYPEFSFVAEWEHNGTKGTVLLYSGGGDWSYIGNTGSAAEKVFDEMMQHGFLVQRK